MRLENIEQNFEIQRQRSSDFLDRFEIFIEGGSYALDKLLETLPPQEAALLGRVKNSKMMLLDFTFAYTRESLKGHRPLMAASNAAIQVLDAQLTTMAISLLGSRANFFAAGFSIAAAILETTGVPEYLESYERIVKEVMLKPKASPEFDSLPTTFHVHAATTSLLVNTVISASNLYNNAVHELFTMIGRSVLEIPIDLSSTSDSRDEHLTKETPFNEAAKEREAQFSRGGAQGAAGIPIYHGSAELPSKAPKQYLTQSSQEGDLIRPYVQFKDGDIKVGFKIPIDGFGSVGIEWRHTADSMIKAWLSRAEGENVSRGEIDFLGDRYRFYIRTTGNGKGLRNFFSRLFQCWHKPIVYHPETLEEIEGERFNLDRKYGVIYDISNPSNQKKVMDFLLQLIESTAQSLFHKRTQGFLDAYYSHLANFRFSEAELEQKKFFERYENDAMSRRFDEDREQRIKDYISSANDEILDELCNNPCYKKYELDITQRRKTLDEAKTFSEKPENHDNEKSADDSPGEVGQKEGSKKEFTHLIEPRKNSLKFGLKELIQGSAFFTDVVFDLYCFYQKNTAQGFQDRLTLIREIISKLFAVAMRFSKNGPTIWVSDFFALVQRRDVSVFDKVFSNEADVLYLITSIISSTGQQLTDSLSMKRISKSVNFYPLMRLFYSCFSDKSSFLSVAPGIFFMTSSFWKADYSRNRFVSENPLVIFLERFVKRYNSSLLYRYFSVHAPFFLRNIDFFSKHESYITGLVFSFFMLSFAFKAYLDSLALLPLRKARNFLLARGVSIDFESIPRERSKQLFFQEWVSVKKRFNSILVQPVPNGDLFEAVAFYVHQEANELRQKCAVSSVDKETSFLQLEKELGRPIVVLNKAFEVNRPIGDIVSLEELTKNPIFLLETNDDKYAAIILVNEPYLQAFYLKGALGQLNKTKQSIPERPSVNVASYTELLRRFGKWKEEKKHHAVVLRNTLQPS